MAFQRTAAPGADTGSTSDENVCGSDASKANIPADRPFGFHLKMNVQILLTEGLKILTLILTFPVFALASSELLITTTGEINELLYSRVTCCGPLS